MIPRKASFLPVVIEASPTEPSIGVSELKRKWQFTRLVLR